MANQDPQPEVYTTVHDFSVAVTSGTQNQVSIFTNQANNEEVRIAAIAVEAEFLDSSGNQITSTTDPKFTMPTDFTMALRVGANNIPSNAFDIGWIYRNQDQTMPFTVPVIVLFQQPLTVNITANSGVAAFTYNSTTVSTIRWKISLISELAIQKVACVN